MPLPPGYQLTEGGQRTIQLLQQNYREPMREEIELEREGFRESEDAFSAWDWQNPDRLGPAGEALPDLAIGWRPDGTPDFGTGLKGWWNKVVSNVSSAYETGYKEGLKISGVTEFAIKKVQGEEKGTETIEQMKAERKPDDPFQAQVYAYAEAAKEVFNQGLWGLLEGLGTVGEVTEQVIGTAGYTLADAIDPNREVNEQTFRENWNASRMAYAGIFDASIFSEMTRRIEAGIRPDLAKQELMIEKKWTLWPELIGQMIFDPLNLITVWTKAGAQAKIAKNVSKTFHEVANPPIAQMLENVADLSKLDDATAYQKIDELVRSQQALIAAKSHAEDIVTAGKNMHTLSNSYKLASLTRDGKIAHLANETGEIAMHVINNSSSLDEAMEVFRGVVKSVSDDPAEAVEGISAMMHFTDPKALFSEAGNNFTVLISQIYKKYGDTWLKTLDDLKGDKVEFTRNLLTKLDEVGEEMFPSVQKMLDAEKAVAAGGEVSEATRALAQRAAELPAYVKAATRFHSALQTVVGPINKFFIGAYMGWSPGYAFRNFSNNSLQLLIDYGPGVLLGKADDMFAKAEKLHGGILQGAFSEGGQAAALFPDARKVGEGVRDTGAAAILGAVREQGLKGPVLGMSQRLEANAAKRIIAKTYRQTFDRGVKAMVKAVTPDLRAAGFSDDVIKKLPTYIEQFDGDAGAVINKLREDVASGVIDMFNDVSRIDPKYKAFLSDAGKWDEYTRNVLQAPTREAAEAGAKKIFDDLAQAGDFAYRDGRAATTVDDHFLKMASDKAGLPETRGQLVSIRTTENRKAIEAAEAILKEADDLAARAGLDVGTMKKARNINEITGWGADAASEAIRIREMAWKATRESRKSSANLSQLWSLLSPDPMPANIADSQAFRDALWAEFDRVMSRNWAGARDTAMDGVLGYIDDLKAAGLEVPDEWADTIRAAKEGAAQYDNAMIGRFGELIEETPLPYGARTSQISQIAQKYGIATATETGRPMDKKILSTINKYAEVNYKSLEDVPLSVAEEAFAKKAGVALEPNLDAMSPTLRREIEAAQKEIEAIRVRQAELPGKLKFEQTPDGGATITFADGSVNRLTPEQLAREGGFDELQKATLKAQQGVLDSDIAQQERIIEQAVRTAENAHYDDAGQLAEPARKRILPPAVDGEPPTAARAIHDQMEEITRMRSWMLDDIGKNFGKKQLVNPVAESALKTAERELTQKLAENRLISSRVAQANRDFTLLNYGDKSYWDVALAYLYPFHFWYKGTYTNWIKRIAQNPAVLAHYNKYKENLATVHAGMPEWYKYNINTNDLPGVDVDNPLYFNLEATLWPLNAITGLDFNDASKRVNGWTATLDYINKFGPSTWTPLSIVTGLALYAQGEREAGEKWMGRIFPQSMPIKAAGSLLGMTNLETDPFVILLQGGLDPYERRRVQRALAEMDQEAQRGDLPYSAEQILDAAYAQEGPIWEEAVRRAVRGRAPSQITSYLFGVGFKGRTQEDMEIDQFYSDYGKLWNMKANLSPEEFREGMDALKQKYPFMDTVMLSKRDGVDRDAGFAYIVMQRIPPGKSSKMAEAAGIDPKLLDKFYSDKGNIEKWSPADRQRFMSGILTMAAVLEIPGDMTRAEWTEARNAYGKLSTEAKGRFGEDILDLVDGYYAAKSKSRQAADAYLERFPEVNQYMDWRSERIINSPLLSAYYGGASMIENYLRGKQYADIEKQLGADIFDIMDEYNDLKTFDPREAKKFYAQNKSKIQKYYKMKDQWAMLINQQTAQLSAHIPDAQGAGIREDFDATSPIATQFAGALEEPEPPTFEDFQAQIPPRLLNLIMDYYNESEPLPEAARTQLDRVARDLGYQYADDLLQAIGVSMYAR